MRIQGDTEHASSVISVVPDLNQDKFVLDFIPDFLAVALAMLLAVAQTTLGKRDLNFGSRVYPGEKGNQATF